MSLLLVAPNLVKAAETVDINRADAATMIANWKGIGEKKARAIIQYRKKHGPFRTIDELANVKGIGEGLIKKNKRYMSVRGGATTTKSTTKTKKDKKSSNTKKQNKDTKKQTGKKSKKKTTKASST